MADRALVLGAGGFLGSSLTRHLLRTGWQVTAVVRDEAASATRVNALLRGWPHLTVFPGDARDPEVVRSTLVGVDAVFSMTGPRSLQPHGVDSGRPAAASDETVALLGGLRHSRCAATAVFAGSRLQYGRTCNSPTAEHHPLQPTTWYGRWKTCEEGLVRAAAADYGLSTAWLRIANAYGPLQHVTNRSFGIAGIFMDLAARQEVIPLYGGGRSIRDFVYVDDVCRALVLAAVHGHPGHATYNVGSGRGITLRDFASAVIAAVGTGTFADVQWPSERAATDDCDFVSDVSRIWTDLRWRPLTVLDEGLRQTWLANKFAAPTSLPETPSLAGAGLEPGFGERPRKAPSDSALRLRERSI